MKKIMRNGAKVLEVFKSFELIETPWLTEFDAKSRWYEIIQECEVNGIMYYPIKHSGSSKSHIRKMWKRIKEENNG